jgi:hypothetical protein
VWSVTLCQLCAGVYSHALAHLHALLSAHAPVFAHALLLTLGATGRYQGPSPCRVCVCSYGPTAWWWEVEELVRKLLLTAVAVLLDAGSPLQVRTGAS